MAKPRDEDWHALKRLGRYLIGRSRYVSVFKRQSRPSHLTVWVDTDWAGCRMTRKSTSGGVAEAGSRVLKCWSSTQSATALSSGEAEYYGIARGAGHGLGLRSLMMELGVEIDLRIKSDASAAIGITNRRGLGKVRHLEVSTLWVQEKVSKCDFKLDKVRSEDNKADALTKHVDSVRLSQHIAAVSSQIESGRHALAPATA